VVLDRTVRVRNQVLSPLTLDFPDLSISKPTDRSVLRFTKRSARLLHHEIEERSEHREHSELSFS
jgi:hypothetical protein